MVLSIRCVHMCVCACARASSNTNRRYINMVGVEHPFSISLFFELVIHIQTFKYTHQNVERQFELLISFGWNFKWFESELSLICGQNWAAMLAHLYTTNLWIKCLYMHILCGCHKSISVWCSPTYDDPSNWNGKKRNTGV